MEWNRTCTVQSIKLPECIGVIMGIQVPLMIIDRSLVSTMTGVFSDHRVTHLRARLISERFSELSELLETKEEHIGKVPCLSKDVRSELEGVPEHLKMK